MQAEDGLFFQYALGSQWGSAEERNYLWNFGGFAFTWEAAWVTQEKNIYNFL